MSQETKNVIAVACIFGGVVPLITKLVNPETPAKFCILLVIMTGLSVYPIIRFVKGVRSRVLTYVIVYLALAGFAAVYWPREPKVRIEFENTRDYVLPPKDRPPEINNWFVRVKVVTDTKLVGARMFFTNISRIGTPAMPPGGKVQIGSYHGLESFDPETIGEGDEAYFGLFFTDPKGNELRLFIPGKGGAEWAPKKNPPIEYQVLQPMPAGKYNVMVSLEADNLNKTVRDTFMVTWSGDMKDFQMESVR